jgi:hypothetical protein
VNAAEWVDSLTKSSMRFMRAALKARTRDDEALFLSNGITALEQLALSLLARQHPLLIIEPKDLNSLLLAMGRRPTDAAAPVRTINFGDCLARLAALRPELSGHMASLQKLYKARNSLVHFGVDPDLHEVRDTVAVLGAATGMLKALGVDRTVYFGTYLEYVDAWQHQGEERWVVTARARIAAARKRWILSTADVDDHVVKAQVAARDAQYQPEMWDGSWDLKPHSCPACHNTCQLEGSTDALREEPPDTEYDEDVVFFPYSLDCLHCGLQIHDFQELEAAGVPLELSHRVFVSEEARFSAGRVYSVDEL